MLYDESSRYSFTTWDAHFKPANSTVGYGESVVGNKMVRTQITQKTSFQWKRIGLYLIIPAIQNK